MSKLLKRYHKKQPKPPLRAVRLYAPIVTEDLPNTCPTCHTTLQTWKGGRGNVQLCRTCNKVIPWGKEA